MRSLSEQCAGFESAPEPFNPLPYFGLLLGFLIIGYWIWGRLKEKKESTHTENPNFENIKPGTIMHLGDSDDK